MASLTERITAREWVANVKVRRIGPRALYTVKLKAGWEFVASTGSYNTLSAAYTFTHRRNVRKKQ